MEHMRSIKNTRIVLIIIAVIGLLWQFADRDPRPICLTTTWGQRPTDYRSEIKYICPSEKDKPYKHIFESDDIKQFDSKKYLKAHPQDMVYIWNANTEPPQSLIIFSDFQPDEKFFRWKNKPE